MRRLKTDTELKTSDCNKDHTALTAEGFSTNFIYWLVLQMLNFNKDMPVLLEENLYMVKIASLKYSCYVKIC